MHAHKQRQRWVAGGALALLAFAAIVTSQDRGALAADADCVGKTYGYPGCPVWAETSSAGPRCGNYEVDEASEECDDGRFNGTGPCDEYCKLAKCGDGKLQPANGEECEPSGTWVYAYGPDGKLTKEKRFHQPPQCGSYCLAPRCEESGACYTGCTWVFRNSCENESSSAKSSSKQGAQTAAVAAAGSSAGTEAMHAGPDTASASSPASVSSTEAQPGTCGNGVAEEGEECDDGNKINNDGCTNACRLPYCGDAVLQPGEDCDDGNQVDTDNCTTACKRAKCGDGFIQAGEECDDGNQVDTDTCTSTCRVARCGDGYLQAGEECDDGNKMNDDNCTNACKLPFCGDGVLQPYEECDDGNQIDGDACTKTCKKAQCGNGIRELNEQCDDGNDSNFDSCTNACKFPVCGNSVVEGREECDDGNKINNDGCTNACRLPYCGDTIVQAGEDCDDGPQNSDMNPNACRTNCRKAACGDNIVDRGEQCDGGAQCRKDCTTVVVTASRHPGATADQNDVPGMTISMKRRILLGGSGIGVALLLSATALFARGKKAAKTVMDSADPKSIEDIPLDQIEMPWHKW